MLDALMEEDSARKPSEEKASSDVVIDIANAEKDSDDGCVGEKECRVCHMGLDKNQDIELGCSCKGDLAIAHKQCAETWFKLKGNRTCEICGSTVSNVSGVEDAVVVEQTNEATTHIETINLPNITPNGQRLLNFLLACVIFAFVISWLFRFSIPS